MNIRTANQLLRKKLNSERWYFEQRGFRIWLMEKLNNTYNRVFPLDTDEVNDFYMYMAERFVNKKRKPQHASRFDKKGVVYSGETEADRKVSQFKDLTADESDYPEIQV